MSDEKRKDLSKEERKEKEFETKEKVEEVHENSEVKEQIEKQTKSKKEEAIVYSKKELYLYLAFLIGSIIAIVAGIYLYFNWLEHKPPTPSVNNTSTIISPISNNTSQISGVTLIVLYNNTYNLTHLQVSAIKSTFQKFGINITKIEYKTIKDFQKKYNITYYNLRIIPSLAIKANESILKTIINKSLLKINDNIYLIKPDVSIFYLEIIAKANYIITASVNITIIEGKYVTSSERLIEGIKTIMKYLYAVNIGNINIINYSSYLNSSYAKNNFEFFPAVIIDSQFPISNLNNSLISTNIHSYKYTLPYTVYSILLQYGYLDYIETTKKPEINNFPKLGSDNANIIFIEYADVHCPYCAMFDNRTVSRLIKEFVNNATVEYVFKDFIVHKDAEDLHKLLRCFYEKVDNKNKYFEVLHWIYEIYWTRIINKEYNAVSYNELKLKLKEYYNVLDLERCVEQNGSKYLQLFSEVSKEAESYGITGTPGILIWKKDEHRGIITLGARSYTFIKYIIEQLMKGEKL